MDSLPPHRREQEIAEILADLRLAPGDRWAHGGLREPVRPGVARIPAFLEYAERAPVRTRRDGALVALSFDSSSLPGWEGYSLAVFGLVVDEAPPACPWPFWRIKTVDLAFRPAGDVIIQLRRQWAWRDGSNLCAELRWLPGWERARGSIIGTDLHHTRKELCDADDGVALLLTFDRAVRKTGGRVKLEEETDTGWIAATDRVMAFKQRHPTCSWKQAAARDGIPYGTFKHWLAARRKMLEESGPK